jgi:excisionase family DNA binding protein
MQTIQLSLPPDFFSQVESIVRKVLSEKNTDEDKLLTSEEVMKLLNISITTLQNWRDEGRIPFKRMGNKMLYSKAEILNSLK